MELTFIGLDSWSRPVYESGDRLFVDVNPRKRWEPEICTKQFNAFDGEPCDIVPIDASTRFIPRRITWD